MARREHRGDALDLAYSTGPWADDDLGETVGGSTDDDTGDVETVGTPETANIHASTGAEPDSDDANPGVEADKTDLSDAARRDELAEMLEAVGGRPAVLDLRELSEMYGVRRSRLSGDLARISRERERWVNEDYEVTGLADS